MKTSLALVAIFSLTLLISGMSTAQVFAHQSPNTCFINNPSLSLSVLRDTAPPGAGPEDVTPVIISSSPSGALGKVDIGEQVIYKVLMKKTSATDDCNYQDGTLIMRTPNGVVTTLSASLPLISGTTEPTGTFTSRLAYVVSAADDPNSCAGGVDGLNDELLSACAFYGLSPDVTGDVQGIAHTGPTSTNSAASAFGSIPIAYTQPYTVDTSSSVKDETGGPVNDPTDTVTIHGDDGTAGTFEVTAVLNGPGGTTVDTPDCPTVSSIGPDHLYDITSTCTTTTDDLPPGDYCWDVTVTETGGNYSPSVVTHTGSEDDPDNECFKVLASFSFSTLSTPTSTQQGSVNNPSDKVTIDGTDGVEGTFETSAVLTGPNSFSQGAICVTTPTTTDQFTFDVICTYTGTVDAPGKYCWDVTVNETGDNYSADSDATQNGADDVTGNECFTVPEPIVNACSPGYWKEDAEKFNAGSWKVPPPAIDPKATWKDTFGFDVGADFKSKTWDKVSKPTLLDALNAQGPHSDYYRLSVNALMNAHAFGDAQDISDVKQVVKDAFPTRDVSHLGFTENCSLNHPGKIPGKK